MAMLRFHESRVQRLLRELGHMTIDQIVQAEGIFIQLSPSGSPVKQVLLVITRNELVVINQDVSDTVTYDGVKLTLNRILPLSMLRFFITDEHERRFIVCTNYGHVLQFEMCRLHTSASDKWATWRDFINTAREEEIKATMEENNNKIIPKVSGFVRRFSHVFAKQVRSIGIQTSDEITLMPDADTKVDANEKESLECIDSDSSSDSQDYEIDPLVGARSGCRPGDRLSILTAYCAPVCLSKKVYMARKSRSMSDCSDHRFQLSFQKELEHMQEPSNGRLKFSNGIEYSPFDSESSSDSEEHSEEDLDDVFKSAEKEMLNTQGKTRAARELWTLVKKRLLKSDEQTRTIVFKKVVNEGRFLTLSQKEEGLPSTILKLDPLDVSLQLANLSRKLLLAVSVEDLKAYAASNGAKVAKALRTALEFSADVRKMVITEIMKNAGYGYCVAWKFFIQIAMNLLFRHHDFQSLIAVLRGLSSLELYRLKNCWATLFVQEPIAYCHYLTLIQLLHPEKGHKAIANRTRICISQQIPFIPSLEHLLEHCLAKRQIQPETNKKQKTFFNNFNAAESKAFVGVGDLRFKTEMRLSAKSAAANIKASRKKKSQQEHQKESNVSQTKEKLTIEGNADKITAPQHQLSDIKPCDPLKPILSKRKPSNTGPSLKLSLRKNKPRVRFDVSESESEKEEECSDVMKSLGKAKFVKNPEDSEEEFQDVNEVMQEVEQSETHEVDKSLMTNRHTDANHTIIVRTPVIDYFCLTQSREIVNSTMLQIASMIKSGKFNNIRENYLEDKSVVLSSSTSSVSEADEQPHVTKAFEVHDITIDDILPAMSSVSSEKSLNRDINTIFENCKIDNADDLKDSKELNRGKELDHMDPGGDKRKEGDTNEKKSKKGKKKRLKLFRSWKLKKKDETKTAMKHVDDVQQDIYDVEDIISDFQTVDDDDGNETNWKNEDPSYNIPEQQPAVQKPSRDQLKSGVDELVVVENNARRASYVPDLVTRGRRKSLFQEAAENKVSDKDESKMFEDLKIKKLNQSKRKGSLALDLLYHEEDETEKDKIKKISETIPSKTGLVASVVDSFNHRFQNEKYNNLTNNSLAKRNKSGKKKRDSAIKNQSFEKKKDDLEQGENIVNRCRSSSTLLFGFRKQVNLDKCSLCGGKQCVYGMEIGELFETIQTRALHLITKSRHRVKNCIKSIITVNKHLNDLDMLQLSLYLE